MRHNRKEVIERTIREYELLDHLVANLKKDGWERLLPRPETKDPWTVKDALAHIAYWKANTVRSLRRQRKPDEERGLSADEVNRVVYLRWRDRSPRQVLTWHREVQKDLLAALKEAPAEWFSGKEHDPKWPFDIDGHSTYHRIKDIERTLAENKA